jgi:hypothetical protein
MPLAVELSGAIEKARPVGRAFLQICSIYSEYQIGRGKVDMESDFLFAVFG